MKNWVKMLAGIGIACGVALLVASFNADSAEATARLGIYGFAELGLTGLALTVRVVSNTSSATNEADTRPAHHQKFLDWFRHWAT